nr:MAG TPA: hypothetical protein [Caudoviricetes sp.]
MIPGPRPGRQLVIFIDFYQIVPPYFVCIVEVHLHTRGLKV